MNLKAENLTIEYLDRLTILEKAEMVKNRSEDILNSNKSINKLDAFNKASEMLRGEHGEVKKRT